MPHTGSTLKNDIGNASGGFYMSRFHSTSLVRGLLVTLSLFVVVSVFVDVKVLVESSLIPAVCNSVLHGKAVSP